MSMNKPNQFMHMCTHIKLSWQAQNSDHHKQYIHKQSINHIDEKKKKKKKRQSKMLCKVTHYARHDMTISLFP